MQANARRFRANPALYLQPFPAVRSAQDWLAMFREDRLRYPLLVVLGRSQTGKTEWVKSLFRNPLELKVGALEVFRKGCEASSVASMTALSLMMCETWRSWPLIKTSFRASMTLAWSLPRRQGDMRIHEVPLRHAHTTWTSWRHMTGGAISVTGLSPRPPKPFQCIQTMK